MCGKGVTIEYTREQRRMRRAANLMRWDTRQYINSRSHVKFIFSFQY